jgi:hypothetical protein
MAILPNINCHRPVLPGKQSRARTLLGSFNLSPCRLGGQSLAMFGDKSPADHLANPKHSSQGILMSDYFSKSWR